jgi:hypothetical protein
MARNSRWVNFGQSFNATYGALTNAMRSIQMGRAMKADYNDDEGNPLTGDALDRARYRALADIETRYGRPSEGLALRSNQAALEATNFENDLNVELRPELLRQRGVLQSGLMEAQTSQANASAANSYSLARERDTLLPGRVEAQGLTNAGLGLANDQAQFNLDLSRASRDSTLEKRAAEASRATSDAGLAATNADVAAKTADARILAANAAADQARADADVAAGSAGSRIDQAAYDAETARINSETAGIALDEAAAVSTQKIDTALAKMRADAASADATTATQQDVLADRNIMAGIFEDAQSVGFESESAQTAYMMEQMNNSAMSAAGRLQYADTVREFGLKRLMADAATISESAVAAYKSGGLTGLVDELYNTKVNDGQTGRIETVDGATRVIVKNDATGAERVVAEASGPGAQERLGNQLVAYAANPMGAMEISAAALAYQRDQVGLQQDRANVTRTEGQTALTAAQVDQISSSISVDEARIRQIESSINVDDARVTQLVAETIGKNLENDTYMQAFNARMENMASEIEARGVDTEVARERAALMAAQITQIYTELQRNDPERPMGPIERARYVESQWSRTLGNIVQLSGDQITDDEILMMRDAFMAGMMPQGVTHSRN